MKTSEIKEQILDDSMQAIVIMADILSDPCTKMSDQSKTRIKYVKKVVSGILDKMELTQ